MPQNKKTFKKDNPALSFMSVQEETEPAQAQEDNTLHTVSKLTAPEGYKLNPEYIEVKSKRVQLLLQPSVVEKLKALATKKGLSMNEAANEAIQEYILNKWED